MQSSGGRPAPSGCGGHHGRLRPRLRDGGHQLLVVVLTNGLTRGGSRLLRRDLAKRSGSSHGMPE
eukprot:9077409-Pyramimonas_sp.AAC.1